MTKPVKSLRTEILERLHMHKGGRQTASANISKATKDFYASDAPQFRGKSKEKRHQMAVAAGLSAARGESARNTSPALTESLQKGSQVLYKGKPVRVQAINESNGYAVIKLPNRKEPIFARPSDLVIGAPAGGKTERLTETFLGMAPIGFTYVEPARSDMIRLEDLTAEDIGLLESDPVDPDYGDEQEEDADNGSNIRHDGHTGKTEVDALPTPSDTIAPAYSDEIPPKQEGTPLSIEKGAEDSKLWTMPDFDGYDYPADAPDIPTADFPSGEVGNSRAPHWGGGHDAGDNQEDRDEDEFHEDFDHSNPIFKQKQFKKKGAKPEAEGDTPPPGYEPKQESAHRSLRDDFSFVTEVGGPNLGGMGPQGMGAAMDKYPEGYFDAPPPGIPPAHPTMDSGAGPVPSGVFSNPARSVAPGGVEPPGLAGPTMAPGGALAPKSEAPGSAPLAQVPHYGPNLESRVIANYKSLLAEMGDMLGGGEHEPKSGDTITLTLPAMASVVCTVANKVHDPSLMKAMIEAMAEVSDGKTIDTPDLEAVAAHINGEEAQEVENREKGRPEHEGIDDHHGGGSGFEPAAGDGEPAKNGKTKLFGGGGVTEGEEEDEEKDEKIPEGFDYYGFDDIVRESEMNEEDEIRLIKKRAGFRYW